MSLRRKLFFTFTLLIAVGFLAFAYWAKGEVRDSHAHIVEDMMVDVSQWVAADLENEMANGGGTTEFARVVEAYKRRDFSAAILDSTKHASTFDFYITDENGRVIYSSRDPAEVGRDYSHWNDVYKTLHGGYGVRATRVDPKDPRTSVYYVAAPIRNRGKLRGVVSVIKARASVNGFLQRSLDNLAVGVLVAIICIVLFGIALLVWITRPIELLRTYALNLSAGIKSAPPLVKARELAALAQAFETMRISLEGKRSIERFTQSLTHELKSPLTGIRGSAELCLEPMDEARRRQFLQNIIEEVSRAEQVLAQLMQVSALEAKTDLDRHDRFPLSRALQVAKSGLMGLWGPREIEVRLEGDLATGLVGDEFLFTQALRNVLQNAIEFSPRKSRIQVSSRATRGHVQIAVHDEGVGIPEFAQARLFEKFFTLERPDSHKKGTGLGLNFVREVVHLHKGEIEIVSPPPGFTVGTEVTIRLNLVYGASVLTPSTSCH